MRAVNRRPDISVLGTFETMNSKSDALTREDKRYEEIFSVEKETHDAGHMLIDDPYPAFAALRTQGPVYLGSIILYGS